MSSHEAESGPYIKLARKFFNHWLWEEHREFSRAEAWLDLIRLATFREQTRIHEGRRFTLKPGELQGSQRFFSDRWNWSKSKVQRFLSMLRDEAMIETRTESGVDLIKLCNYETYNSARITNGPATSPPADQRRTEYKKEKEMNNQGREEYVAPAEADDSEIPTKAKAMAQASNAGIAQDFAEYVFADWFTRGGKDAGGVVVPFIRYAAKRWARERGEWENGQHRGRKQAQGKACEPKIEPQKIDEAHFRNWLFAKYPRVDKDATSRTVSRSVIEEYIYESVIDKVDFHRWAKVRAPAADLECKTTRMHLVDSYLRVDRSKTA